MRAPDRGQAMLEIKTANIIIKNVDEAKFISVRLFVKIIAISYLSKITIVPIKRQKIEVRT